MTCYGLYMSANRRPIDLIDIYDSMEQLTQLGRDKMAAMLQTTFWNSFSYMKIVAILFKFH